ncbi:MAG: ComEC/Rec2 family competence protein [Clostridia bacterium]|nr:ComEC/Rec2 family competence protein [Clostridia bacterium]
MVSYSGAAAVMIVIGSLLARITEVPYSWILTAGIFLVLVPVSFCAVTKLAKNKDVWILAIVPVFLFTGWFVTEIKTDIERRPLYPFMGEEVEIHGTVCSVPVNYGEHIGFMLETAFVKSGEDEFAIREKIKISTDGAVPTAGSPVVLTGEVRPVSLPRNSTSFDSNSYNKRRGVYFTVFTQQVKRSSDEYVLSLPGKVNLFLSVSMDLFIKRFPSPAVPLLKGMVLNNKSEIPDEVTEAMLRVGTYRYIYSPYLHISILIFVLGRLFGSRRSGFFAGICIFLIYLFMNITVPSAWKICLFFGISYILMGVFRVKDIKIAMYLTVIFTALVSPLTLTEPGFVISVTATALVRGFSESLSRGLYFAVHNRKLARFLSIYLIMLVGIYPISSFFGYAVTPWSMIIGLVLMPVVVIIYALFYVSFGIFLISGSVLYMGVPLLVRAVEKIAEMALKLPFASLSFGACSLLVVVTFYLLLYCIYRRLRLRGSMFYEILTGLLCIVVAAGTIYGINDTELTFLSVGNSDCAVIIFPGGKTLMVDGGGSEHYSDYDVGSAEVIPYLSAKGINKIDSVIVSHYDKDHADGIVTVMKYMPVGEIFMPDYLPNNDYRDIIEAEAKKLNTKVIYITEPRSVMPEAGGECEFLYCNNGNDGNDNSLVARIICGKTSILFTGDISSFAEYKLTDTKSDIVKVPHHGSKYSSSETFIKCTDADYGVICVGENNSYGHPSKDVLARYDKYGTVILRTDLLGDIHFIIGKNRIKRIYGFREWFIYGGF